MTAAAHHKPLTEFLEKATDLINAGQYRAASEAFVAFEKEHPTSDYHVLEAIPFRIQNHLTAKGGTATAFTKLSLRNTTWTTELVQAFRDPAKFEAFVQGLEAKVKELAAPKAA
jgi:hypothetical protein